MASSNAEVKNRLVAAIDRCIEIQTDHLAGLKAGCLSKVNQWLEERQTMIVRLEQAFLEVRRNGIDADFQALLLGKLGCILDIENVIFNIAGEQRAALSEKLSYIRRGKRTLARYEGGRSRSPRFVSDNS